MARFLALDAETSRFHLLAGSIKGAQVRLESSLVWDEEQALTVSTAAAVGHRLRERLKQENVAAAPLLVCIGRDRVVLKELKIPNVPPHEQPAVVRFQAMKEFAEAADESVLDFIPVGTTPMGELRVQVLSIKKDVLTATRTFAEAAGLTLAAVTPRPFALLAGWQQAVTSGQAPPAPADGAIAILVRGDKWGAFTVARAGAILQARSIVGPALSSEAALVSELRRNLAIHTNHSPDQPVRAIYLAEPDTPGGLREHLETALSIPVHAYEPVVGVSVPDGPLGGLVGPAGLLALRAASADLPINFAHPRQPTAPRDPGKRLLAIAGIAAATLVLVLGAFAYLNLSVKTQKLALVQREKDETDEQLRSLDPDAKRLKALDDWAATDVNWLDELYDMTARISESDLRKMRFTSLGVAPLEDRSGKTKYAASMTVKVITTEDHVPVDKLRADLSLDPQYRFPGWGKVRRNTTIQQGAFVVEYEGRIDVERRPPDKYTRTFTATAPSRRSRGGDDVLGFPGGFGGMAP